MAVQISLFASDLHRLLMALKHNRQVNICDADVGFRICEVLKISGDETRPFSDEELRALTDKFAWFKPYFEGMGLWPGVSAG